MTLLEPLAASIVLLGAPYAELAGATREFLPERRFQLVAYLAYRGEWVTRDALAFLFWPDQDNAGARRNLRWVLHAVRELPEFNGLEAERDRVRLQSSTDVRRFQAAVQERLWADAVELYRGAFCLGLEAHGSEPFAKWLMLERGRLAELFRAAALELIRARGADDVVRLARRLLEEDPADEDALAACLRALQELDRGREAKRVYREYAERLMEELGLEPSAAMRALLHELEAPTRSPAVARPVESSFIGRTSELAQIKTLLAEPGCRLLTLIGPGGVGKSRLARQAVADRPAQSTWLVALEGLAVPGQVAAQMARVIGLRLSPRDDAATQVKTHLMGRQCLLILDNFEHLIDAAELLAQLLAACPQLQVMVTSRERLGLAGEWLLPVEGLAFPRALGVDVRQYDAVRLFVERAQAVNRGFDAHAEQAAIADIVARIEGMPLAIELAAAWVHLLPCSDIARDVASSFDLLETDTAPRPEHQSVRAAFDHSWALLMARERLLFASLSVFRGGFGREAVRHVASSSLQAIAQLVDKSLLRADAAGRFSMHPLLQRFAEEKLAATSSEEHATRQRHAEFFTHWMERFGEFRNIDVKAAMEALDTEADNCLVAWNWAIAQKRVDLVSAASAPLLHYFENKGLMREGLACFESAATALESPGSYGGAIGSIERARSTLSLRLGHYARAEEHGRRALRHFRLARDEAGIKSALMTLGLSHWQRARSAQARPYFMEGLKRTHKDGDRPGEAGFLINLALIAKADGRYEEVEARLLQAIAIYRDGSDVGGFTNALNNLGNHYRGMKEPARARSPLLEALALAEDTKNALALPFVLINLALVELELGRLDAARGYCARALEVVRRGSDRQIEVGCNATLARIALAHGATQEARRHIRASATLARQLNHIPLLLDAAVNAATALRLENLPESAAAILYMVRTHPAAGQPDRDEVDRELAALRASLPEAALEAARQRAAGITLDEVIAQAITPPSRPPDAADPGLSAA